MKSNIEHLYEELRKATDGGSESMTHDDALKQIAYWREKCSTAIKMPDMPAFPTTEDNYSSIRWSDSGMTLRDYFAARALQFGIEHSSYKRCAEEAYKIADAMIEARNS